VNGGPNPPWRHGAAGTSMIKAIGMIHVNAPDPVKPQFGK
jgi:hypothetical protein